MIAVESTLVVVFVYVAVVIKHSFSSWHVPPIATQRGQF